ncbi:MAG: response regulator transcription factor [Bacteroidota bacterium]|nr:response regulator transcription factor [Bacteroidota bacterium]
MTRVAFVDDKSVNRASFANKIGSFNDLEIVFVAVNGHECLEQLKGLPLSQQPHVVFVDLEMPELDGIQTIRLAKSYYPQIHFIVLTVFDDDDKIFEAIRAGATGYLLKDENAISLRNAITHAIEYGGAPMSPAIARKTFDLLSKSKINVKKPARDPVLDQLLSEREKQILQYTINGFDAKRIAEILDISALTVRKHISNIYEKLHVNSKAQIISLAYQKKWFDH